MKSKGYITYIKARFVFKGAKDKVNHKILKEKRTYGS